MRPLHNSRLFAAAAALACAALLAACSAPGGGSAEAAGASGREPLQIGKLIKKRKIAPVTSVERADWLTRPEREEQEKPDRVAASLGIRPGDTVVDFGAGVGYFTWRLARQVGPEGRVIAVDIQQAMLDLLEENLRERNIGNVEMILADDDDPRLPARAVDLVLMVDTYHELAHPALTMRAIRRSLKPGGRVVIIEYRRDDPTIPIHPMRRMTAREVREEVEPIGFELAGRLDFVPTQHILIFKDSGTPE